MALDRGNLIIRSVSGLVYAGLLIGAIICGPLASAILMSVFGVIACFELESKSIGRTDSCPWQLTCLIDAGIIVSGIFCFVRPGWLSIALPLFTALLVSRFILQIFIKDSHPLYSIGITALEQFYITLPLVTFVICTAILEPHPWVMVCALSMIWINDTGAYLTGSLFGRHKMFPTISPKKSWEGFLGGLVFNIGAAFLFFYCFKLNNYSLIESVSGWIFIGIWVTVFATLGDLFESMLKRSLGIKDFGNIIPGHGGILDRIDSLLFVVPGLTVAFYLALLS